MAEELDGTGWDSIDADSWPTVTDAIALWAVARNRLGFHRRFSQAKKGNKRLRYLLGATICRRVAHLFPDPRCHKALQTAEAYAEGTARLRSLVAAYNAAEGVDQSRFPAAVASAIVAAYWCCCPDDYHIIQSVEQVIDVAGYQAAVAAGVLTPDGKQGAGRAVWKR